MRLHRHLWLRYYIFMCNDSERNRLNYVMCTPSISWYPLYLTKGHANISPNVMMHSAILDLCEGYPPNIGGSHHTGPVMRSLNVIVAIKLEQAAEHPVDSLVIETPSRSYDVTIMFLCVAVTRNRHSTTESTLINILRVFYIDILWRPHLLVIVDLI